MTLSRGYEPVVQLLFPDNVEYVWLEGDEMYDCGNKEGITLRQNVFILPFKETLLAILLRGRAFNTIKRL